MEVVEETDQGRAAQTGEALFGRVSEVDPYQESCPALPRTLSEADRFTAWRLAVASLLADRQAMRGERRRRSGQEVRANKTTTKYLTQEERKNGFGINVCGIGH